MNKSELVEALTERLGDRKAAARAVEAVFDTITRTITAGEKVSVTGFGTFERVVRAPRQVRNPATGETLKKKKTAVAKFRAGASLKAYVSGEQKLPKLTAAPAKAPARKAAATSTAATSRSGRSRAANTATAKTATAKKTATAGRRTAKKTAVRSR